MSLHFGCLCSTLFPRSMRALGPNACSQQSQEKGKSLLVRLEVLSSFKTEVVSRKTLNCIYLCVVRRWSVNCFQSSCTRGCSPRAFQRTTVCRSGASVYVGNWQTGLSHYVYFIKSIDWRVHGDVLIIVSRYDHSQLEDCAKSAVAPYFPSGSLVDGLPAALLTYVSFTLFTSAAFACSRVWILLSECRILLVKLGADNFGHFWYRVVAVPDEEQ